MAFWPSEGSFAFRQSGFLTTDFDIIVAMSTTLLSIVTTSGHLLADPVAVELASLDGTFGVRRTDTGGVVVPSGTAMVSSQTGVWTYEFTDPEGDISYECSIKVTTADDELYFTYYRYAANEVADVSLSDSISVSQSASTVDEGRSITLSRSAIERVPGTDRDLFKLTLTAEDAVNMPLDVFVYIQGGVDPRDERSKLEYFFYVATPFDACIYPVGSPDSTQFPGWYRKSTIEFLAPSTKLAEVFEQDIRQELAGLVEAYNKLDVFETVSEVVISGNQTVEDVVLPTGEFCSGFAFYPGEQLSRVQSEANNF